MEAIEQQFRQTVCADIRLMPEGLNRYQVFTPFRFSDGDHFVIVLKKSNGSWVLSDEGHTLMHLSYEIDVKDLEEGNRLEIFAAALSLYAVSEQQGELSIRVPGDAFGNALFNFIQALMKISDVTFLSRERVRSTFLEDFRAFIRETVPADRYQFDWHHPDRDPTGKYLVDCRINRSPRPLVIYALTGDDKVKDANIGVLMFENWRLSFQSLAIFEDVEEINRRVLARFLDVCDRTFSTLSADTKPRIRQYLEEALRS